MMNIRPFDKGDRPLVEVFFAQMGGESRAFFNRGSFNERRALAFFEEADDPNILRWLAEEDGRMIGYVYLWDLDTTLPWLGIAVAEDYKGKGLGRALMAHAEDCARREGYAGILLTTHIANIRGQALYARTGYRRMGMHDGGEILYLLRFERLPKKKE